MDEPGPDQIVPGQEPKLPLGERVKGNARGFVKAFTTKCVARILERVLLLTVAIEKV